MWLVAATLVLAIILTDVIVQGATLTPGTIIPVPEYGGLYPLYIAFIVALLVFSGFKVAYSVIGSRGVKKKQMKIVGYTFIVASIVGLMTNTILPKFLGNSEIVIYFPLSIIVLASGLSYAIAKHKLFDIRSAAVRTFAYIGSLVTLGCMYYLAAVSVSVIFFGNSSYSAIVTNPINVFLALGLAFIFQPVKQFFDKVTNSFFYRNRYRTEEFYSHLSEVLTTTNDLREMLSHAAHEIKKMLKTDQAFFIVADGNERYTISGTSKHNSLPPHDIHMLNVYIEQFGDETILTEHIEQEHRILKKMLISHKVELTMPLVRHGAIIGYLALGEQLSTGYTARDVRVLKNVRDELIIAIQNALSVQEVKDINASLEQRIEMATSELRRSNARLQRLDETKDEFISMASHQLRTPLTSIKGYLSMMLEGDMGKITPMQKQVLDEAFSSSERMVHLIHDFLNVSRLQTGKFMLEMEDTDLAKLVGDEVESLTRVAKSRDITLEFSNVAGELRMNLDNTKIRQVVMNFIDNAIYYSHPNTSIKIALSSSDDAIVFTVKDTGIGVPKNEQAQLFGKFYRASNARKQRPDGTGVGIYLAKKVIVAHKGEVLFESKVGKGSMFGFSLPTEKQLREED